VCSSDLNQANILEKGINIPKRCRVYLALFWIKRKYIALPSSFPHCNQ